MTTSSLKIGGDIACTLIATQTLLNKTLTAPVISTISNFGTLTLPLGNHLIVGEDTNNTLTNKALILPQISSIVNTGTLTLPTTTGTILTDNSTATVSNKTIDTRLVIDKSTAQIIITPNSPAAAGTALSIVAANIAPRIYTIPDNAMDGAFILTDAVQTMNNKTIDTLTATGTSQTLLSGKLQSFYFTSLSTVGTASVDLASVVVPNNASIIITIETIAECVASVGIDLDKVSFSTYMVGCKNVSGTLTSFEFETPLQTGDLSSSPTQSTAGTNLVISMNGIAGDTIAYSGNYSVSYQ